MFLPKVLNLNPRSIYNKVVEYVTFVKEEEVDLTCISESWERGNQTLNETLSMEDYEIISNVFQRKGIGGGPAIIANKKKYEVENLTQSVISVPWGVEAVWAILTPKIVQLPAKYKKLLLVQYIASPIVGKKRFYWTTLLKFTVNFVQNIVVVSIG